MVIACEFSLNISKIIHGVLNHPSFDCNENIFVIIKCTTIKPFLYIAKHLICVAEGQVELVVIKSFKSLIT